MISRGPGRASDGRCSSHSYKNNVHTFINDFFLPINKHTRTTMRPWFVSDAWDGELRVSRYRGDPSASRTSAVHDVRDWNKEGLSRIDQS